MPIRSIVHHRDCPRDPWDVLVRDSDGGTNPLVLIVRLLTRQAAHEYIHKSHETDGCLVELPGDDVQ